MLQVIGMSMILLASASVGFYYAHKLMQRCQHIRYCQMALQVLETEICYGSTPLEIAFERISNQELGAVAAIFKHCSRYLQEEKSVSTSGCWQKAVQKTEAKLALKKTELEWLYHLGEMIGASDRLDQQKHLQLVMTQLKKAEKDAYDEQQKKTKLYQSLGVLLGLTIVILLI